jgi:hypothetical protein
MVLKPILLSAFSRNFTPPVTGINGSLAPVATNYDTSGHFQSRPRAGSVKRKRMDEIDMVYDLGAQYPPLVPPAKPKIDLSVVRGMVVAAGTAGMDVRGMIEDPNLDEKTKSLAKLNIALLDVVEAILESGLVPLSMNGSPQQKKNEPPATAPKPIQPGLKELKEGLERAEKESVLFGSNLGPNTMANRNGLVSALCSGIRDTVVEKATENGADPNEAVRDMEDALSCVTDMEFIGEKSKKFIKEGYNRSNTFCTMPVKFKFEKFAYQL